MSPPNTSANMPASNMPETPHLKTAVILLFKSAPPFVLYTEDPEGLYQECLQVVKQAKVASPRLIEKTGIGPIKRVAFLDTELLGVSIQVGIVPQLPL